MQPWLAGILWRLAAVLALVGGNGFFVAAEYSIVTVRRTRIEQLVAEGHRGARAVQRAIAESDRYIAATQLGITMASLGLGWIGEPSLASLIQPSLEFMPARLGAPTAHSVAVAVAFTVITAFHIVFGELAPKWVALERSERTALWVVAPTAFFMRALWPFIRLLHGTAQAVVHVLGLRVDARALVHSEEELKMLVTASQEAGVLEEAEEQMLHRVLGFADLAAGQVMIPRTEVVAIGAEATRDVIVERFASGGHTRLPVYRGDIDHPIGMLYAIDVLNRLASGGEIDAGRLAREALTVPETLGADDLLAAMRARGVREALVIDEYGGTAGFVTFEALMERIVGDLGGARASRIVLLEDGSARIDGLTLIADLNERLGLHLDEAAYTTVGGFMLGRLGRRARVGDVVDVEGRRMRVETLDGLRIARVWLSQAATAPTSVSPGPTAGHDLT